MNAIKNDIRIIQGAVKSSLLDASRKNKYISGDKYHVKITDEYGKHYEIRYYF